MSYGLISPSHLRGWLNRLPQSALSGSIVRVDGDPADEDENDPEDQPWWKQEDIWGDPLPAPSIVGSTAIVPVKGVITSGYPSIFRAIGFADTEEITGWVRAAKQNPDITRILMAIDSPGGMVTGTPELAAEIDAATLRKEVFAHTKGMMDSAAYWVASQCNGLYCTASADVGCIGVYQMHYDWTGWLDEMGIKAEMFKSGDLKGAGHPDISLTADQKAHIQGQIDLIGIQFRAAVKGKRTMISDDSMRGQSFLGTQAAELNLVNGIRSFESLL